MKLYTESLWAAGRGLMKDSVTVERITNTRLLDTVHYTHTYLQRRNADTHTHIYPRRYRQTHTHFVTLQATDFRANGSWSVGVGGGDG